MRASGLTAPRRSRARARGFTLLEVLAAVAVFGIVYTLLAQVAMQGLAAEGDATRRLQASLLADRALGELEAQLAAGTPIPPGLTELEEGDFLIETEVGPFDLASLLPAEVPRYLERPGSGGGGRTFAVLAAPPRGLAPLLAVQVRVRWVEGAFEQQVSRTTFATDAQALAPFLEAVGAADQAAAGADEDEDEAAGALPEETDVELPELPEAEQP